MGAGHVCHNLGSHIVQSVINVAMVLTSILLISTVSLDTVIFATSASMGGSTAYLIWRKQKVLNTLAAGVHSGKINQLICE